MQTNNGVKPNQSKGPVPQYQIFSQYANSLDWMHGYDLNCALSTGSLGYIVLSWGCDNKEMKPCLPQSVCHV